MSGAHAIYLIYVIKFYKNIPRKTSKRGSFECGLMVTSFPECWIVCDKEGGAYIIRSENSRKESKKPILPSERQLKDAIMRLRGGA